MRKRIYRDQNWLAFTPDWFKKYQSRLLFLLNTPYFSFFFRRILRIDGEKSSVGKNKIVQILPHAIVWGNGGQKSYEFRTHWKFSKRIYFSFRYAWWAMHYWDEIFAEHYAPEWSFGLPTLTAYPDPNPETSTVDGRVRRNTNSETWATIRSTGTDFLDDAASIVLNCVADTVTDRWDTLDRFIALFDTAPITDTDTIDTAVLSVYGTEKDNSGGFGMPLNVYTSTPASNTALAAADYDQTGTTAQATQITIVAFSTTGYNDFTFNATGRGNVTKTGISKFSVKFVNDSDNSQPTWSSGGLEQAGFYNADQAGMGNDPKLVVTSNPLLTININDQSTLTESISTSSVLSVTVVNKKVVIT